MAPKSAASKRKVRTFEPPSRQQPSTRLPEEKKAVRPARRPEPVQAPGDASTWEEELWRLRRRYAADGVAGSESFKVTEELEPSLQTELHEQSAETVESETLSRPVNATAEFQPAVVLQLVLHCSDPDWEAVNWAPDGLLLEVSIPLAYPAQMMPRPQLRVLGPSELPDRFAQLLPLLFAEFLNQAPPNSPAVYRALHHVDRHATALFLKIRAGDDRAAAEAQAAEVEAAKAASAAAAAAVADVEAAEAEANKADTEQQNRINEFTVAAACAPSSSSTPGRQRPQSQPWSSEEQTKLEVALGQFQNEVDTKTRWKLIAEHVGSCRSARDCAERFQRCRDFALGKISSLNDDEEGSTDEGQRDPDPASLRETQSITAWTAADVRRQGVEVRLLGLSLEGFIYLSLISLRLQVVCTRCKKPSDLASEAAHGTEPRIAEAPCPVCKQVIQVRIAPSICHGGCPALAHVLGVNCQPTQLLRSDVEAACGECNEFARIRNVGPGYRKKGECNNCYTKMNIAIEGAELLGSAVAQWKQIAEDEGDRMTARRQLHEARQRERDLGVKAGQPLPENGTCKHYSKSYRWLRFPCCGRAFPCDVCHDEQMDHPHEWANRMLCGRCSHEQPFSKDKCAHCGASQTRSRSSYWEGGEGCRNRTTMSKNDPHKYRGLGKTVSSKK